MPSADSVAAAGHAAGAKKRIMYIATRDLAYARNSMFVRGLATAFDVETIASTSKHYWVRIPVVALRLLVARLSGRLSACDAVFVGFMAQPILPFVRLLWHGRLISDAYLSVYETIVEDRRQVRPQSWLARLARRLDGDLLRYSDLVVTDTEAHADFFRRLAQPKGELARVWLSAEIEQLGAWSQREHGDEPFEVLFWGAFIPLQGVDVIVRAAALLRDEAVRFTLAGTGQTFSECVALSAALGADNVKFVGWQPLSKVGDLARSSHLALGIFGSSDKAARVIPNKVFEALAMGMPVISGDSPAARELLTDGDDILTVPMGSPEALAERIRFARANYAAVQVAAQRGQATFQKTASFACITRLLVTRVRECLDGDGLGSSPAVELS